MTAQRLTVVLASDSATKLRELRGFFAELPIDLVPARDVVRTSLPPTSGAASLSERALEQARLVGQATTLLTIADATGLEVDALAGQPGLRSAHFAHEHATDAENNAALLRALADVEPLQRTARFRCCLALFDPWGPEGPSELVVEGVCEGEIARGCKGAGGFGYDPLFRVGGQGGRTLAELSDPDRAALGHRAAAARALLSPLRIAVFSKLNDVVAVSARVPSLLPLSDLSER